MRFRMIDTLVVRQEHAPKDERGPLVGRPARRATGAAPKRRSTGASMSSLGLARLFDASPGRALLGCQ
jgi:hypothetical protein